MARMAGVARAESPLPMHLHGERVRVRGRHGVAFLLIILGLVPRTHGSVHSKGGELSSASSNPAWIGTSVGLGPRDKPEDDR